MPVLNLRASTTAATERKLRIFNPQIDCSAGDSSGSGNECTAINTQYFQQVLIESGYLYGGEEPDNLNADSGWTPTSDIYARMEGTRIRGFGDLGVYATGDNNVGATGDGFEVMLRDVTLERCSGAVGSKRELNQMTLDGCTVSECISGAGTFEITSPYVGPGRRLDIFNTTFRKVTANIARWRGPAKGSMIGCTVEDFGYDYDGTGSVGANAYAITIDGASGIQVKDNDIRLNAWTRVDHRAIKLSDLTLDSVTYNQGGHHFAGNTYRGLARIVVESGSGTGSVFIGEHYEDISGVKFNSLNAASIVTYTEDADAEIKGRIGSSDYSLFGDQGTFTPVLEGATTAGSGTYSTQNGRYTVQGRMVSFEIEITWTAHTGTGGMRITGLPANALGVCPVSVLTSDITFSGQIAAYVEGGQSRILLRSMSSGSGHAGISMDTAGSLFIAGSYTI